MEPLPRASRRAQLGHRVLLGAENLADPLPCRPLQDVREALIVVDGTDYGVHSPTWISRFSDMTRQASVGCPGPVDRC